MNVNIKNYSKIFKCSNLKSRCPDICYNKFKCAQNCKAYSGKCKNSNSALCRAIRRCKCINIKGKRIGQRCKAQKRLTILSNDRNTQRIRQNKASKILETIFVVAKGNCYPCSHLEARRFKMRHFESVLS